MLQFYEEKKLLLSIIYQRRFLRFLVASKLIVIYYKTLDYEGEYFLFLDMYVL